MLKIDLTQIMFVYHVYFIVYIYRMYVYAVMCPSLRKNQKRKHTSIYVYML